MSLQISSEVMNRTYVLVLREITSMSKRLQAAVSCKFTAPLRRDAIIKDIFCKETQENLCCLLPNTYYSSVACYGLSPTFKGSTKGSFAFRTIGHHLSRNTTPVHSLHVSSYSCIGPCSSTELILNSRRISVFLFLSNFVYPAVLINLN
jgi:hypothetical protein